MKTSSQSLLRPQSSQRNISEPCSSSALKDAEARGSTGLGAETAGRPPLLTAHSALPSPGRMPPFYRMGREQHAWRVCGFINVLASFVTSRSPRALDDCAQRAHAAASWARSHSSAGRDPTANRHAPRAGRRARALPRGAPRRVGVDRPQSPLGCSWLPSRREEQDSLRRLESRR